MGRPPLVAGEIKGRTFSIRLSLAEREEVEQAALRAGASSASELGPHGDPRGRARLRAAGAPLPTLGMTPLVIPSTDCSRALVLLAA